MNSSIKGFVGIMAVAILCGLGFFGGYIVKGNIDTRNDTEQSAKLADSGKKVSEGFIKAITGDNVEAVYANASTAYKARNNRSRIQGLVAASKSQVPTVGNEEVFTNPDNSKAIYVATLDNLPPSPSGRTAGSVVINLIQEGNSWKVDAYQVY